MFKVGYFIYFGVELPWFGGAATDVGLGQHGERKPSRSDLVVSSRWALTLRP